MASSSSCASEAAAAAAQHSPAKGVLPTCSSAQAQPELCQAFPGGILAGSVRPWEVRPQLGQWGQSRGAGQPVEGMRGREKR